MDAVSLGVDPAAVDSSGGAGDRLASPSLPLRWSLVCEALQDVPLVGRLLSVNVGLLPCGGGRAAGRFSAVVSPSPDGATREDPPGLR